MKPTIKLLTVILLFSFDIVILNEGVQCTCVAGFVGSKTIELNQSIKGI